MKLYTLVNEKVKQTFSWKQSGPPGSLELATWAG